MKDTDDSVFLSYQNKCVILMTLQSSLILFGTMVFLAALPSTSVFTVLIRSATAGLRHGLLASLGIVLADLLFVAVAIYGLAILVQIVGEWWVLLLLLGSCYLCWSGWNLLQAKPQRLQKMMQSHCEEALKLLNSSSSKLSPPPEKHKVF